MMTGSVFLQEAGFKPRDCRHQVIHAVNIRSTLHRLTATTANKHCHGCASACCRAFRRTLDFAARGQTGCWSEAWQQQWRTWEADGRGGSGHDGGHQAVALLHRRLLDAQLLLDRVQRRVVQHLCRSETAGEKRCRVAPAAGAPLLPTVLKCAGRRRTDRQQNDCQ